MKTLLLTHALGAWGRPDFEDVLKRELEQFSVDQLPLQQGMTTGSHALDTNLTVMILRVRESETCIRARAGIFYTGVVAGCNCADDPTPVDEQSEYCEVELQIDRQTAETSVVLLD